MLKRILLLALVVTMLTSSVFCLALGEDSDAIRFYNPDGGSFAHRNPYCTSVSKKHLPLQVTDGAGQGALMPSQLKPCSVCGTLPEGTITPGSLALFLDLPFGTSLDTCTKRIEQSFSFDTSPGPSEDDYHAISLIPSKEYSIFENRLDHISLDFMQEALCSVGLHYDLVKQPYDRSSSVDLMDIYLPVFFSLMFQLEQKYGAPTNGGMQIGDQYPYSIYNYPMQGGERDASKIIPIIKQSPKNAVTIFEVYGNVILVLSRVHYDLNGRAQASCVISILYENRDDLPEGSLAPFIWPNGEYAL